MLCKGPNWRVMPAPSCKWKSMCRDVIRLLLLGVPASRLNSNPVLLLFTNKSSLKQLYKPVSWWKSPGILWLAALLLICVTSNRRPLRLQNGVLGLVLWIARFFLFTMRKPSSLVLNFRTSPANPRGTAWFFRLFSQRRLSYLYSVAYCLIPSCKSV